MMRRLLLCSSAAFSLLVPIKSAFSEDLVAKAIIRSMETALVFLKSEAAPVRENNFLKDDVLKPKGNGHEKSDPFIVDLPPDLAREYMTEKFADVFDHVEANPVYLPFPASCTMPSDLPATAVIPPGITSMGGPLDGNVPTRKVWIIDSGVYTSSTLLNIDFNNAAVCTAANCQGAAADHNKVEDDVGHGTFVSGIIAGENDPSGSIVGMLPGAAVVPIKVYSSSSPVIDNDTLRNAIKWIKNRMTSGDVVNMSWGAVISDPATAGNPYSDLEVEIMKLADKGAKISIAAGNYDAASEISPFITGGYVELITPARIGGYRSGSGGIVTVSAIDSSRNFWFSKAGSPSGSAFGNGIRPDFAAPGVDIDSLWIGGNKKNTCTGTSFAAAHVSGALLQGNDILLGIDGTSTSDVDNDDDQIAVCMKIMGKCTIQ
jgi:hypothetical protein